LLLGSTFVACNMFGGNYPAQQPPPPLPGAGGQTGAGVMDLGALWGGQAGDVGTTDSAEWTAYSTASKALEEDTKAGGPGHLQGQGGPGADGVNLGSAAWQVGQLGDGSADLYGAGLGMGNLGALGSYPGLSSGAPLLGPDQANQARLRALMAASQLGQVYPGQLDTSQLNLNSLGLGLGGTLGGLGGPPLGAAQLAQLGIGGYPRLLPTNDGTSSLGLAAGLSAGLSSGLPVSSYQFTPGAKVGFPTTLAQSTFANQQRLQTLQALQQQQLQAGLGFTPPPVAGVTDLGDMALPGQGGMRRGPRDMRDRRDRGDRGYGRDERDRRGPPPPPSKGGGRGKEFFPYHHTQVPRTTNLQATYGKDTPQEEEQTTLMIRNIPNRYKQQMLMNEIDQMGFADQYDFLYLPIDFQNDKNVGYAFINFKTTEAAKRCTEAFTNYQFKRFPSHKIGRVSLAHVQGLQNLLHHFEKKKVMESKHKHCQPFIAQKDDYREDGRPGEEEHGGD